MNNGQPLCASLVSRKPLRHAAPNAIFTQFSLFTQAFYRFLWGSWETEAGKAGRWRVFQIPSIAQPGFRKLTLCQPSLPQAFQPAFHFSALNYGYYYLFLYLYYLYPPVCRLARSYPQNHALLYQIRSSLPCTCVHRANDESRRNPEKQPSFPRAKQRKGAYNQEEEKKVVSGGRQIVVQCGQRGFCFDRDFSLLK